MARQIGDYVVERELGRGAFGVVYRAHRAGRPDAPVALKVVEGRGNTDRLMLEPAVLARLEHPCIVRLEDYFLKDGDLVLALEFIDGKDLKALLDEGETFTPDDVGELLVQVGSALAAAHAENVVHRDIKPANILVTRRPGGGRRYVLTDFGIGQLSEGIQVEKAAGGTYLFMAPEQLRGRPGPQADLWALGVVAYRLLTGRLPFPGPTLRELTAQILYGSPPPPSELCAGLEGRLETAVLHLLDRSLEERTPSAEQLLAELGRRGRPDELLVRKAERTARSGGRSLDEQLASGVRRRKVLLACCVAFTLLPLGLLSGTLLGGGLFLFVLAQRTGRWGHPRIWAAVLASLLLLAGHLVMRTVLAHHDLSAFQFLVLLPPLWGVAAFLVLGVGNVVVPVVAAALFVRLRRLQRERLLRDLMREGAGGSDRYLRALRQAVDGRFEDVGLHLKYAEALLARGRVAEAAVEAKLLLWQDPYHWGGNLLLANAYYALGLHDDCRAVCDAYLAVSGYCFELGELAELSARGRHED
jgi:serine/threonine-protein kinase